jgi:hypothetical protein
VLLTPRDVSVGLADRVRGALVSVSALAPISDVWFQFNSGVDFSTCMPADQQPTIEQKHHGRWRRKHVAVPQPS